MGAWEMQQQRLGSHWVVHPVSLKTTHHPKGCCQADLGCPGQRPPQQPYARGMHLKPLLGTLCLWK